jgi:hypothetical protein
VQAAEDKFRERRGSRIKHLLTFGFLISIDHSGTTWNLSKKIYVNGLYLGSVKKPSIRRRS